MPHLFQSQLMAIVDNPDLCPEAKLNTIRDLMRSRRSCFHFLLTYTTQGQSGFVHLFNRTEVVTRVNRLLNQDPDAFWQLHEVAGLANLTVTKRTVATVEMED